jgi:outer membrane cobalamin receptor
MRRHDRHCRRAARLALALALAPAAITAALADDAAPTPRLDGGGIGGTADASPDDAANANDTGEALSLPKLVVTGTREELKESLSPGSVSVVYPDDVRGEHKSLPDLLDQIPGVYVRRVAGSGQYTTTSVRGSTGPQVNVYVDGVPMNLGGYGAVDLSTLPMSNVERVEIYRGYVPANLAGAPIGGAINIVTKKPDGVHGGVSYGMRSWGGRQASTNASAPVGDGNILLGIGTESSDGDFRYKHLTMEDFRTTPSATASAKNLPINRKRMNNSYDKQDFLGKYQDDTWTAKWAYNYINRMLPGQVGSCTGTACTPSIATYGIDLPYSALNIARQQKVAQHDGLIGWHGAVDDLDLNLGINYLNQTKSFRNLDWKATSQAPFIAWTRHQTNRIGATANASYKLGDSQLLEFFADANREELGITGNDVTSTDALSRYSRKMTHLQLQDTITLGFLDDLQVSPVVRVDRADGLNASTYNVPQDKGWKPTQGVGLKKQVGEEWTLRGTWGTYNRFPTFYELFGDGIWVRPNPGINANYPPPIRERSRQYDFGPSWRGNLIGDLDGNLGVTYFKRKVEDAVGFLRTANGSIPTRAGDTRFTGAEVEGGLAWGKRADWQFAVTRQEGKWTSPAPSVYLYRNPTKVTDIPDLTASSRFNLHFLDGDLTTFADFKYIGRVYVLGVLGDYEEHLATVGLGMRARLPLGFEVTAGVDDITNAGPNQRRMPQAYNMRKYVMDRNVMYPGEGRTFYGTLAWKF